MARPSCAPELSTVCLGAASGPCRFGSFDGYADGIESAIYLVNREPIDETFQWIDSETGIMLDMQRPNGHIEDWYGEGNFNRTALPYAAGRRH